MDNQVTPIRASAASQPLANRTIRKNTTNSQSRLKSSDAISDTLETSDHDSNSGLKQQSKIDEPIQQDGSASGDSTDTGYVLDISG